MKDLKITTSQIAKICNVSQGTVDRALNNRPDIKAETKQKVNSTQAQPHSYLRYDTRNSQKSNVLSEMLFLLFLSSQLQPPVSENAVIKSSLPPHLSSFFCYPDGFISY